MTGLATGKIDELNESFRGGFDHVRPKAFFLG
jgi:hypothetical protein